MPQEVYMDNKLVGVLGLDGKMTYDKEKFGATIKEIVAGKAGSGGKQQSLGSIFTSIKVVYRFDKNRKSNNDAIYTLYDTNPIASSRVKQLKSLVFGKGLIYTYDESTQQLVDRFWRLNRLRRKLGAMCTNTQLYGELFIGLFAQPSGDVTMAAYESNQVEIDFDPANIDNVNRYIVGFRNEETNKDELLEFMPIETYLNNIEFGNTGTLSKAVKAVRKSLGLTGSSGIKGAGVMIHIKFNNTTSEPHGKSDFKQVYQVLNEYMDFRGDRLAIHQMYGSPSYDIEIDTDDPDVISRRIEDLAGFTIGSNPVHNTKEKWTPLEFKHSNGEVEYDEKAMRGLICAGTGFPEHLLFNQGDGSDDGAFALNKLAEDMQIGFHEAFIDMHKFVVAIGGGDITKIDEGQIIFPEISTMPEKAKAETYVLKVGANICSRETAAMNTGHNWKIEQEKILNEMEMFDPLMKDPDIAGAIGGRFSTKKDNQDPNRDDGSDDRKSRADGQNISTQVMGDRKTNN